MGMLDLKRHMLETHGPMLTGEPLRRALGFQTYAAFHRSNSKGVIGVRIFSIPGRRGQFALTTDVADWIEKNASQQDTGAAR
jgi:hypothetical protein